jgi:CheY-like chemotaxis protein
MTTRRPRLSRGPVGGTPLSVLSVASAQEVRAAAVSLMPGCLIADMRMPGKTGLELQQRLNELALAFPTIIITDTATSRSSGRDEGGPRRLHRETELEMNSSGRQPRPSGRRALTAKAAPSWHGRPPVWRRANRDCANRGRANEGRADESARSSASSCRRTLPPTTASPSIPRYGLRIAERLAADAVALQIEVAPADPDMFDKQIVELGCRPLAIAAKAAGDMAAELRASAEKFTCDLLVVGRRTRPPARAPSLPPLIAAAISRTRSKISAGHLGPQFSLGKRTDRQHGEGLSRDQVAALPDPPDFGY